MRDIAQTARRNYELAEAQLNECECALAQIRSDKRPAAPARRTRKAAAAQATLEKFNAIAGKAAAAKSDIALIAPAVAAAELAKL